jgi:hypothetical protein
MDSWRTAAGHTLVVLVPSSPIALRLTRGGKLSISASSDTGSCASVRPLHGGQCLRISSEDASTSCGQNHVATSCPNTAHCLFCHGGPSDRQLQEVAFPCGGWPTAPSAPPNQDGRCAQPVRW